MLFFILISIVFIAELIVAFAIIFNIIKADKNVNETNSFLKEANPKIDELVKICTKISEQLAELSPKYVKKTKDWIADIIISQAKSFLIGFLIVLLKKQIKKG